MALNKIEIIVTDGGGGCSVRDRGVKSITTKQQAKTEDLQNKKLASKFKMMAHPIQAAQNKVIGKMSPAGAFATSMAIGVGKQLLSQSFNYFVSNIGLENGDSNFQNIVNKRIEIVNDTVNVLSSVASGAAAGAAVGGLPGAAVGALLSGASAGMSIGFRQAERERSYQYQLFKERNSQADSLARANYSVWTGRAR